jgi:hypothetical protein
LAREVNLGNPGLKQHSTCGGSGYSFAAAIIDRQTSPSVPLQIARPVQARFAASDKVFEAPDGGSNQNT